MKNEDLVALRPIIHELMFRVASAMGQEMQTPDKILEARVQVRLMEAPTVARCFPELESEIESFLRTYLPEALQIPIFLVQDLIRAGPKFHALLLESALAGDQGALDKAKDELLNASPDLDPGLWTITWNMSLDEWDLDVALEGAYPDLEIALTASRKDS